MQMIIVWKISTPKVLQQQSHKKMYYTLQWNQNVQIRNIPGVQDSEVTTAADAVAKAHRTHV